ncbi:2OG-Fe(II) oxygenase [Streptomyces sp. AM2-3-1]|uniref:2OG-Fe(II) oxygenase family protein n=1 Tax=Streptomyces sp. AM2-3-1 TaxID=3075824 RepID=UPI0028C3E504|nr:2OG-Fe(II) oxygenase [Streptomyces sp. AM2-3-1]WNO67455.1 2OG-Fe(II) oxygenase [Streptomyces sp. AM2-3-1]
MSDTKSVTSPLEKNLRQFAKFVNPQHVESMDKLSTWIRSEPAEPLVFRDFLIEDRARAVAKAMRGIDVWSRCATTYHGTQGSAEIPESEWALNPHRAARHFVARPLARVLESGVLPDPGRKAVEQFLAFAVLVGPLRSWLSAGSGLELDGQATVEFACYSAGDEIRPHQDLLPGRVMAVNFYLDEAYEKGTGGRLGYRNETGEEFFVDPLFNTFSLIPVREECWHWVEPFRGEGVGRYTVSIGQNQSVS